MAMIDCEVPSTQPERVARERQMTSQQTRPEYVASERHVTSRLSSSARHERLQRLGDVEAHVGDRVGRHPDYDACGRSVRRTHLGRTSNAKAGGRGRGSMGRGGDGEEGEI